MGKYPSGQAEMEAYHKSKRTVWIVVTFVIIIIALFGAATYLHRPVTGTVTAVDASSITIRPNGGSATKTYKVTSTTLMGLPKSSGEGGVPQQFDKNDIQIGETVVINVNPRDNQVQAITVNP